MSRHLLAISGGLVLSAAFPPVGLAGAAWVAPGLILFSAFGARAGEAFRLGFVAGLAHFLSSLYWLLLMPDTFHGIPLGPAAGWLALSAYCALYPALWVWLSWKIRPRSLAPDRFFSTTFLQRTSWALACAALWVALEMARGRLLTGFPWNFLGASQYKMLPVIQIASLTGIYGVSFIIVWLSVSLVLALLALTRRPPRGVWREAGLPLLTVLLIATWGARQLTSFPPADRELNIVLIQPSIPQTLIWTASDDDARFQQVLALSDKALTPQTTLLIWPESALSALTPERQAQLAQLLSRHQVWLVACADDEEFSDRGVLQDFNSSLLLNPQGARVAVYHKRRLVIFGEYVPPWLAFLKWVTPIDGAFTPGSASAPFNLENPSAQFSTLICFEDIFPSEARDHVTAQTDFLVNLTNDGWFGQGAAQWQHAANAVFRAVENGVPLVRCANNGITCWVDARGRLRKIFNVAGNVYAAGSMAFALPLRATPHDPTFYNLHGDFFGWACCAFAFLCIVRTLRPWGPP